MFRLALVILAASDLLGPPLRQDGYSFRPPKAFHMTRMDLFHGAKPLAIGSGPESSGQLSASQCPLRSSLCLRQLFKT